MVQVPPGQVKRRTRLAVGLLLLFCLLLLSQALAVKKNRFGSDRVPHATAQEGSASVGESPAMKHFQEAVTVAPEYKAAALQLMTAEVSQFGKDLGLPEKNRPNRSNVV